MDAICCYCCRYRHTAGVCLLEHQPQGLTCFGPSVGPFVEFSDAIPIAHTWSNNERLLWKEGKEMSSNNCSVFICWASDNAVTPYFDLSPLLAHWIEEEEEEKE